jgi:hypothetical protein
MTAANGSNSRDHNAAARHYNSLLHSAHEPLDPLHSMQNQAIAQFPPTSGAINTMNGMCGYRNGIWISLTTIVAALNAVLTALGSSIAGNADQKKLRLRRAVGLREC